MKLSSENVDKVRKNLLDVDVLPTISTMFEKIIRLLEEEGTTVRDLEKVIRLDQVISMRILKIINSAMYGFNNITSISHAISLLGFNKVQNVVLSASLSNVFNVEYSIATLKVPEFWLHSIGTAYICRMLSEQTGRADPEEMFTLGLLHDIGKVAYMKEAPDFFEALIQQSQSRKISLDQVENELGLSHAHLGWFLCEKWNFPTEISTVIKNHHSPDIAGEYTEEVCIVNLGDYLAHRLKIGRSGNLYPQRPAPEILNKIKMTKNIWDHVKEKLQEQKDSIIKLSNELLNT